jgi:hypothetical protein
METLHFIVKMLESFQGACVISSLPFFSFQKCSNQIKRKKTITKKKLGSRRLPQGVSASCESEFLGNPSDGLTCQSTNFRRLYKDHTRSRCSTNIYPQRNCKNKNHFGFFLLFYFLFLAKSCNNNIITTIKKKSST